MKRSRMWLVTNLRDKWVAVSNISLYGPLRKTKFNLKETLHSSEKKKQKGKEIANMKRRNKKLLLKDFNFYLVFPYEFEWSTCEQKLAGTFTFTAYVGSVAERHSLRKAWFSEGEDFEKLEAQLSGSAKLSEWIRNNIRTSSITAPPFTLKGCIFFSHVELASCLKI